MMAYRTAGITIPQTSQQQWDYGTRIPPTPHSQETWCSSPAPTAHTPGPGHVGIIIVGNGKMIEAYATGYPIRIAAYGQPTARPGDQVVIGVTRPS